MIRYYIGVHRTLYFGTDILMNMTVIVLFFAIDLCTYHNLESSHNSPQASDQKFKRLDLSGLRETEKMSVDKDHEICP